MQSAGAGRTASARPASIRALLAFVLLPAVLAGALYDYLWRGYSLHPMDHSFFAASYLAIGNDDAEDSLPVHGSGRTLFELRPRADLPADLQHLDPIWSARETFSWYPNGYPTVHHHMHLVPMKYLLGPLVQDPRHLFLVAAATGGLLGLALFYVFRVETQHRGRPGAAILVAAIALYPSALPFLVWDLRDFCLLLAPLLGLTAAVWRGRPIREVAFFGVLLMLAREESFLFLAMFAAAAASLGARRTAGTLLGLCLIEAAAIFGYYAWLTGTAQWLRLAEPAALGRIALLLAGLGVLSRLSGRWPALLALGLIVLPAPYYYIGEFYRQDPVYGDPLWGFVLKDRYFYVFAIGFYLLALAWEILPNRLRPRLGLRAGQALAGAWLAGSAAGAALLVGYLLLPIMRWPELADHKAALAGRTVVADYVTYPMLLGRPDTIVWQRLPVETTLGRSSNRWPENAEVLREWLKAHPDAVGLMSAGGWAVLRDEMRARGWPLSPRLCTQFSGAPTAARQVLRDFGLTGRFGGHAHERVYLWLMRNDHPPHHPRRIADLAIGVFQDDSECPPVGPRPAR